MQVSHYEIEFLLCRYCSSVRRIVSAQPDFGSEFQAVAGNTGRYQRILFFLFESGNCNKKSEWLGKRCPVAVYIDFQPEISTMGLGFVSKFSNWMNIIFNKINLAIVSKNRNLSRPESCRKLLVYEISACTKISLFIFRTLSPRFIWFFANHYYQL